jgi:hypothetical protein
MRYLILLALIGAAFGQEHPTAAKCLSDVSLWDNQLVEHVRSIKEMTTQPFSTEAGQIPAYIWLGRQEEITDCVNSYHDNYAKYESVVRRIDSLLSVRYLGFILDTNQGSRYKARGDTQSRKQHVKPL